MPVSESDFLANPEAALAKGERVPIPWMRRAWKEHPTFREDVTYYLARSVSKVGTFELAAEVWLEVLPHALSGDEAAALYADILEQSQRLEFEWRPAFVAAFPSSEPLLPDSRDREILRATLEQQILTGYGVGFEMLVESLLLLPEGASTLRQPNEKGETLLGMAQRLDRAVMVAILNEATAPERGAV